jgi:chlorophyll synthase
MAPTRIRVVLALCQLARPAIWMVSVVPLWAGYVLATHQLAPTSFDTAVDATVALVVMGSLVWAAALAVNDVADLPSDRLNLHVPRSRCSLCRRVRAAVNSP